MEKELNLNYNKARLFCDLGMEVHITMFNGFIHNGKIEHLEPDFFLLEDNRKGLIPIFFIEVVDIEKYEKENKDGTAGNL